MPSLQRIVEKFIGRITPEDLPKLEFTLDDGTIKYFQSYYDEDIPFFVNKIASATWKQNPKTNKILEKQALWTPGTIGAGVTAATVVSFDGVEGGDHISLGLPINLNFELIAKAIPILNNVNLYLYNPTAGVIVQAGAFYNIRVIKSVFNL